MINIRHEKQEDIALVASVHQQAFKRDAEAKLADKLRKACPDYLSLVADDNGTIVGHIMFTPVLIQNDKTIQGMGLAPMAVLPARQYQGIGTLLVKTGLQILDRKDCPFIIVLGHPGYYARFGFQPASKFNIKSQWDGVPDEAFMLLVKNDKAMQGVSGVATFKEEFNKV